MDELDIWKWIKMGELGVIELPGGRPQTGCEARGHPYLPLLFSILN